jgi:hypothetical protein
MVNQAGKQMNSADRVGDSADRVGDSAGREGMQIHSVHPRSLTLIFINYIYIF